MPNPTKPKTYQPPSAGREIRLQLSRNESSTPLELPAALTHVDPENVIRYPSMKELQESIGGWLGISPDQIVISAGGDDALERVLRISIDGGRKKTVTHAPSFEMVDIYAENHGGYVETVEWQSGEFPLEQLVARIDDQTGVVVLVSPNNPTGSTIATEMLLNVADVCDRHGAILLVDNAYIEFADTDPLPDLRPRGNVLVLRTFSKAWGMAGLRVGYLVCPNADRADLYRAATGPFPVSGVSMALAKQALETRTEQMRINVRRVCAIRDELVQIINQCGGQPFDSQGNFVLARFDDADNVWKKLSKEGIAVRIFNNPQLEGLLRITCPTTAAELLHFAKALIRVTGSDLDIGSINVDFDNLSFEEGPTLAGNQATLPLGGSQSRPVGTRGGSNETTTTDTANARTAQHQRKTKETDIDLDLNLDGTGQAQIDTGIGFLDHMLTALAFHSRIDLRLNCKGDLHIDDHHTAEDCAIALGTAIDQALGERKGIVRFGYACAPLDEALARTVIDLSGRPWPEIHLDLTREMVGTIATENITHVFVSLAMTLKCSLHVDVLRGTNDHHRAEAAFKSLALALRQAIARSSAADVPSTKGVL